MLIESYVVEFKEVKKCLAGLKYEDFILVSENIFSLSESSRPSIDLLSEHTPINHPEALLLVNKEYAKNLIMNEEFFEFLKKSHDIKNLNGVTLHIGFANAGLIQELSAASQQKVLDSIKVKIVNHESLLVAQKNQEKKYKDDKAMLKKAISIYI
jgi:hypothetical protein